MKGRALTATQKRVVLDRVLAAWEARPEQRLGQLLTNTFGVTGPESAALFYVEDEALADGLERYVR